MKVLKLFLMILIAGVLGMIIGHCSFQTIYAEDLRQIDKEIELEEKELDNLSHEELLRQTLKSSSSLNKTMKMSSIKFKYQWLSIGIVEALLVLILWLKVKKSKSA